MGLLRYPLILNVTFAANSLLLPMIQSKVINSRSLKVCPCSNLHGTISHYVQSLRIKTDPLMFIM